MPLPAPVLLRCGLSLVLLALAGTAAIAPKASAASSPAAAHEPKSAPRDEASKRRASTRRRAARRRAAARRRRAAAEAPAQLPETPAAKPAAPASTVDPTQWLGDFETGSLGQWNVQAAATDRVTLHSDTPRQGRYYARLRTEQGDLGEASRSQLNSPYVIRVDSERYLSWSTRFPAGFPIVGARQRVMFMQAYGAPFTYSPLVSMRVVDDKMRLTASRSVTSINTFDGPIWEMPVVRGEWNDFTLRIRGATDLTGWVELWHNGVPQTFTNGATRYPMQTIELAQTQGLKFILNNYRGGGFTTTVIDHDGGRVAATAPAGLAL